MAGRNETIMKKQLILEDGTIFTGEGFGSNKDITGEVVFTTGMTGYQETLSDPSFCGQIVTFTYPLIGNYGINRDDFETIQPAVKALVVKEAADFPSNFRSEFSIDEYLKMKDIPAISGIDTRKLTRIIRKYGALKGAIVSADANAEEVVHRLQATVLPTDQVAQVSTKSAYPSPGRGFRVVLMDFGMKHGILRELNNRDCDVTVVPHDTTGEQIMQFKPDGIMLTNGPGDPKDVPYAIETVKYLIGKVPVFGICLGHQLFALASGADTFKLKFGHRGSNHPVKDLETGRTALTSQNHGYAVDEETIKNTDLKVTHLALNDGTVEGLAHKTYPAFTVQYHPEASPGPEDDNILFDRFIDMMKKNVAKEKQNA